MTTTEFNSKVYEYILGHSYKLTRDGRGRPMCVVSGPLVNADVQVHAHHTENVRAAMRLVWSAAREALTRGGDTPCL